MKEDDAADFLSALKMAPDPARPNLISFELDGTVSVGDSATTGDFTFGLTKSATVTLVSYCGVADDDKVGDAFKKAAAAITIPHDLDDLRSIPAGVVCQLEGPARSSSPPVRPTAF